MATVARRRNFATACWLIAMHAFAVSGCGIIPKRVSIDDPQIQPLLQAAASFDRTAYGFTPIPRAADVRFESRPTKHYDAMLHIAAKTARTIAFRKTSDRYRWIGEQEIFEGPKEYKTVDGTFREHLCFTYETESISGYPANRLNISYVGEDARLTDRADLRLADVKTILKEWGY